MTIARGTRIGPYEVNSVLGSGGMGVVYRARDAKLQREVALKFLPDHFARDPERLSRFQREGQVLASLNHPNIAQIYGMEQTGETGCIVMELVEGETLADRVSRGPIAIDEALQIASQVADAVEAAHERGVMHRDLKPANIKITPGGQVKVLDFGLAKVLGSPDGESDPSNSPTLMSGSMPGMILGTAAYMSPEQARGKSVDARTDVWAFGCVLYEMLTARKAFEGETATDSIAKILAGQPDWTLLPAGTPSAIRTLLAAALNKDPRQRLQHIHDARLFLHPAVDEPMKQRVSPKRGRGWVVTVALTLGFVSALIPGTLYFMRAPEDDRVTHFVVNAPDGTNFSGLFGETAISPDGRKLAFSAYSNSGQSKLWVQSLDDVLPRALAGTESSRNLFWSPDSQRIAFFAQGNLKKVSASGGSPETISRAAAQIPGIWSGEDEIIFGSTYGALYRVSAKGGNGTPVTVLDKLRGDVWHFPLSWLPDNRHFLYMAFGISNGSTPGALMSGALDSKDAKLVSPGVTIGVYVKPGYYLSLRDGAMMVQEFDPSSLQLKGDASQLLDQASSFSVSTTGVLAYMPPKEASGFHVFSFDRQNRKTALGDIAPENYRDMELSPDGKQLALERYFQDTWLHDLERGVTNKTTFPASWGPRWSSDGAYVAFSGNGGIYRKRSTGGEQELLLNQTGALVSDYSADGQKILYSVVEKQTDLWIASLDGKEWKGKPLVQTDADERNGRFSPDGRWVAYESNESGQYEVYVRPSSESSDRKVISKNGGAQPRWRRNGKELFFLSLEGKLMTVAIETSSNAIEPGIPQALFDAGAPAIGLYGAPAYSYAVTPDGQHFYVAVPPQTAPVGPNRIHVVLNWPGLLKKQKQ